MGDADAACTMNHKPRLSDGALFALILVMFTLLSYGAYAIFQQEIQNRDSGVQADYKIDAYYYLYLGQQAKLIADRDLVSLYEAADSIRPNAASDGIVFLSAALQIVVSNELLIPHVLALCLYAVIGWTLWIGCTHRALLMLPFCGLFPYLQVPSKEIFFLIGMLFVMGSVASLRHLWLCVVGLILMYLARRDAFYIAMACIPLAWAFRRPARAIPLCIAMVTLYFAFVREPAHAATTLAQVVSEKAELAFCEVGPLNVCVDDIGGMEIVFFVRLVTLCVLPFKWVYDAFATMWLPGLDWSEILVRWSNCVQLLWLVVVCRGQRRNLAHTADSSDRIRAMKEVLLMFALVYCVVYASVVYFQPTRQVILALNVAGLALVLRRPTAKGGKTANKPTTLIATSLNRRPHAAQ
jgi:hypothetical protein